MQTLWKKYFGLDEAKQINPHDGGKAYLNSKEDLIDALVSLEHDELLQLDENKENIYILG